MVRPLALVFAYGASVLVALAWCRERVCLQDGRHKSIPSPEPNIKECALYMENACCSEQDIEDLSASPAGVSWDRCGTLSPQCEQFLKRVICFYRCSPDATYWPYPQHGSSLRALPLCHSFCRDWYEVCKSDLTCARDWTSDPTGQNCTGNCIPYHQMYQHGRDLCESLWGDAFMTLEDEAAVARGHSCGCLNLTASDREVIAALRRQKASPDELDTTKHHGNTICIHSSASAPEQGQKNHVKSVFHKRSAPGVHDSEGSGSGF
ncbi:retbindin isoform X1 [Silurus asotus]|uniref:Retbindin isoform X1 n=1 Tax=Silurus asotus TaxID=30991 RepID=A0AAD5AS26_SILAS|nr:retbindin isoform X1 [Silurus asotus]